VALKKKAARRKRDKKKPPVLRREKQNEKIKSQIREIKKNRNCLKAGRSDHREKKKKLQT